MKLFDYYTTRLIAVLYPNALNEWCDRNGYLPHRKIKQGWIVIKTK